MRSQKTTYILACVLSVFAILASACAAKTPPLADNISVAETGAIDLKSTPITLTADAASVAAPSRSPSDFTYGMKLIAQVNAINVSEKSLPVQANDIDIKGSRAYIAYNYAGAEFAGAIQIVDISKPDEPSIIREIKFKGMDINAVYARGTDDRLIFGGQADPDIFGFNAFVGSLKLSQFTATDIATSFKALPSFAVTSITRFGDTYYVGVGAKDGGIVILDKDLNQTGFKDYPDMRDVGAYHGGLIGLAGTTDSTYTTAARLILGDASGNYTPTDINNFNSSYKKATVEILRYNDGSSDGKYYNADSDKDNDGKNDDDKNNDGENDDDGEEEHGYTGDHYSGDEDALVVTALSELGLKVWSMSGSTATSIYSLANPTEANYITDANSASLEDDLLFVANGEYGFRVLQVNKRKDSHHSESASSFASIIGYHRMEGDTYGGLKYSANYITYKSGYLFVASGSGGVNIFSLKKK